MGLREQIEAQIEMAREMTDEEKIKAMVDFFGYTREEAANMLVDAGQIEPGWCEG